MTSSMEKSANGCLIRIRTLTSRFRMRVRVIEGVEMGVFRAFRFRVFPCVGVRFRVCGCHLGVSVAGWWFKGIGAVCRLTW